MCLRHLERIARGWSKEAPCSAQWFWQHPSGVCSFCPWQFLYSLASCWKFHSSAITPHSHSNVFIHWRPQVCLSPGPGKDSAIVGFTAAEHTVWDWAVETPCVYGCAINPDLLLLRLCCAGVRDGGGRWRVLRALLSDLTSFFTLLLSHNRGMAQEVLTLILWSLQDWFLMDFCRHNTTGKAHLDVNVWKLSKDPHSFLSEKNNSWISRSTDWWFKIRIQNGKPVWLLKMG